MLSMRRKICNPRSREGKTKDNIRRTEYGVQERHLPRGAISSARGKYGVLVLQCCSRRGRCLKTAQSEHGSSDRQGVHNGCRLPSRVLSLDECSKISRLPLFTLQSQIMRIQRPGPGKTTSTFVQYVPLYIAAPRTVSPAASKARPNDVRNATPHSLRSI
jgi:hypothetical protein